MIQYLLSQLLVCIIWKGEQFKSHPLHIDILLGTVKRDALECNIMRSDR